MTVTDSEGNVICTYTPTKDYQSVVVSTPELVSGGTWRTATSGRSGRRTGAAARCILNSPQNYPIQTGTGISSRP